MALCEICNKNGYAPDQMSISFHSFVGPCCATPDMPKVILRQEPALNVVKLHSPKANDLEYGVEVSNKVGVRAYANYQGLSVNFEKSPDELKHWAESQGLMTSGT